jgi:hypothetical protein
MTSVTWERWARASGIGFVVLFVAAYIVFGDQPAAGAPADEVVAFYDGDRSRILTASFLLGLAILFLIWFAGAVANALREAGEGRLAATTVASAATLAGFLFVITAIGSGLAYTIAGAGDAGVIQALSDLLQAFNVISAFPAAGLIAAATVGLWQTRMVPDWFGWAGIAAGLIVLLGTTTWATDGFWASDGAFRIITIIAFLVWTAVTSWILYARAPVVEPMPERTAATPMS